MLRDGADVVFARHWRGDDGFASDIGMFAENS
jgi:hypothetical protein